MRRLGFVLCGLGLLVLAWAAIAVVWGDPVSALYTRHEQAGLSARLETVERDWNVGRPVHPASAPAAWQAAILRFRRSLEPGDPVGRIVIPRIGLDMVVVEGTGSAQLAKGPGHYDAATARATSLPGLGGVIAIAGHRTTFLHPFLHIDELARGSTVTLVMPYGRFVYRVIAHRVVVPTDWSILRRRPFEELVLTACHPKYSASHRYVVFARLVRAVPNLRSGSARPPVVSTAAGEG